MQVIVIDDGINEKYVEIEKLYVNIEVTQDFKLLERKNYNKSAPSHGSICARIILHYYDKCELGSIKVLDESGEGGKNEQLLIALEWCLKKNIKVINMSLGTKDLKYYTKLNHIIAKLSSNGCIIINACNIQDVFSMPSCFPNVIGVGTDYRLISTQYMYNICSVIGKDVSASSRHKINGDKYTEYSTSFATPFITSKVCEIISKKSSNNICKIKKILANENCGNVNFCLMPSYIYNPVVISYVDKIHFKNLKTMEWSAFVNIFSNNYYELLEDSNIIVLPEDSREFTEAFIRFLTKNKSKIISITYCYVIPLSIKKYIKDNMTCLLWYENISEEFNFEKYNSICNIPVISVQDDDNDIMKHTDNMKNAFLDNGYRVVTVSDRKYSYLHGVDLFCNKIDNNIYRYLEQYYEADVIIEYTEIEECYSDICIKIVELLDVNYKLKKDCKIVNTMQDERISLLVNKEYFDKNTNELIKIIEKIFDGETYNDVL